MSRRVSERKAEQFSRAVWSLLGGKSEDDRTPQNRCASEPPNNTHAITNTELERLQDRSEKIDR